MTEVKICGITNIKDALAAQKAGTDFLGFVFAESPRSITTKKAKEIIARLSKKIKVTALFVDQDEEGVHKVISEIGKVDCLQFHGGETPDYCARFKGDKKIIKAFRIRDERSIIQIEDYVGVIDFALLDAYSKEKHGGTGKAFDWSLAQKAKRYHIPIILSGGLNPGNVKEAILKVNPFAVDVSSGVEKAHGIKDAGLVRKFIKIAKAV